VARTLLIFVILSEAKHPCIFALQALNVAQSLLPASLVLPQPTTESLPLTFPLRPLRPSHSRGIHNHVESIAWLAGHF
jgi:hypothetical protein